MEGPSQRSAFYGEPEYRPTIAEALSALTATLERLYPDAPATINQALAMELYFAAEQVEAGLPNSAFLYPAMDTERN